EGLLAQVFRELPIPGTPLQQIQETSAVALDHRALGASIAVGDTPDEIGRYLGFEIRLLGSCGHRSTAKAKRMVSAVRRKRRPRHFTRDGDAVDESSPSFLPQGITRRRS